VVTLRQQMTEWPGDEEEEEEKTEGRSQHRTRRDRFSDEVVSLLVACHNDELIFII
jgi:hypothetical protein